MLDREADQYLYGIVKALVVLTDDKLEIKKGQDSNMC